MRRRAGRWWWLAVVLLCLGLFARVVDRSDSLRDSQLQSEEAASIHGRSTAGHPVGASMGPNEVEAEDGLREVAREVSESEVDSTSADDSTSIGSRPSRPADVVDRRLDYMTQSDAAAYALLHQDHSIEDLRSELNALFARVPPEYVNAAHFEAIGRGEFEVLKRATKYASVSGGYELDHQELAQNLPFLTVVMKDQEGRVIRSRLAPNDFPAYREEVVHAIWIHFEKSSRREHYFRSQSANRR
jgi:hypothetical protein